MVVDTVVLRIHLPLVGVGLALHELLPPLATPAGEEADTGAGFGLIVDHKVGVVTVLTITLTIDKGGQAET